MDLATIELLLSILFKVFALVFVGFALFMLIKILKDMP